TYTPLTRTDPTYGGRVIQLLGARIDDLVVEVDSGLGGWEYQQSLIRFCRDILKQQTDETPTIFEYTSRQWKLAGYLVSVPIMDDMSNVLRTTELTFKVQEDISGIVSQDSLSMELVRLQDGIGWRRSQYNQPVWS